MNIKEIAPKLTQKLSIAINDDEAVEFAEALIAEVAKQNVPVAWARYPKFTGSTQRQEIVFKKPDDLHNWVCLYTFPPTAEQIANETAWQPIETAPKDGTVFLGYKLGQFRECYKVPRDDCDMWCFGGVSGADDLFPNIKPTHWMPLPTPPKRSMEGV